MNNIFFYYTQHYSITVVNGNWTQEYQLFVLHDHPGEGSV